MHTHRRQHHPYKGVSDVEKRRGVLVTNHGSAEPPWNSTIENGELGLISVWMVKLVISEGKIAFSLFQFEGSEPMDQARCQYLKSLNAVFSTYMARPNPGGIHQSHKCLQHQRQSQVRSCQSAKHR